MIQIAITAFLVWAFFKFADKSGLIDGFTSITFVLVPAILIFIFGAGAIALGLPQWVNLALHLTYFLVPMLLLRKMTTYSWAKVYAYSGVVFGINVLVTLVALFVLAAPVS